MVTHSGIRAWRGAWRPNRGRIDPRLYQIACLSGLLAYGLVALRFEIGMAQVGVTLASALGAQWLCTRLWRLPTFEPKSALISGLSLSLLLRTNHVGIAALAASLAIASKFVLRWNGKHLFNPTNVALVATLLATGRAWVSPGQWGSGAFFAFLLACAGGLVVNRATRSDVTYAFIAAWCAIVFGRAWWLGQPLSIPLHQLENGALLLFTFFMISDPRTTPDARAGRIAFALLVAAGAGVVQFGLFRTNGLLWSLAGGALVVPLINRVFPSERFAWARPAAAVPTATVPTHPAPAALFPKGAFDETSHADPRGRARRGGLVLDRP